MIMIVRELYFAHFAAASSEGATNEGEGIHTVREPHEKKQFLSSLFLNFEFFKNLSR